MNTELSNFAARLREGIRSFSDVGDDVRSLNLENRKSEIENSKRSEPPHVGSYGDSFNSLALELFALQFQHNASYRKICERRGITPETAGHWTQIPAVPTVAFKELEMTCLAPAGRTAVFHSSGTTGQKPSRHFHNAGSLAVYGDSLWPWFQANVAMGAPGTVPARTTPDEKHADSAIGAPATQPFQLVILTPPPASAPHSSLVHMFEIIRQKLGAPATAFVGKLTDDGAWTLDFRAAVDALSPGVSRPTPRVRLLLGTAFSFVHLLDYLAENDLRFQLPAGSRVMETGGYKNRSRSLPKTELHQLITERLGVPRENIICEYGMSELSSQAYDAPRLAPCAPRLFRFPHWARVQIVSPETGREVAEGETGLIRVYDLANVFSVMAVQTEDLGVRRGGGFELTGRAAKAEARGCSLMTA